MSVEFKTDFFERLKRVNRPAFLGRQIGQIGVIAVNFSKERFVQKNWLSNKRESWQARKRPARGSILVRSGRLKRSVRKISQGNYYVYIGTDVPYAQIHNEGGEINKTVTVKAYSRRNTARARSERTGRKLKKRIETGQSNVKAHTRKMNIKMPKRQYLGESAILNRRIERHLSKELDREISNTGNESVL